MSAVLLKRIAAFAAVFLWLFVIFSFSREDAGKSSGTSASVIDKVATVTVEEYKDYTPPQKIEFIESWQHTVRKAAHFTEFFILGVLTFAALLTLPLKSGGRLAFSSLFCLLCAFFDELSQTFSLGRSMQVTDMLIDFSGAVLGIIIIRLFTLLVQSVKNKRANKRAAAAA